MESISAVNESGTLDTLQRAQIDATLDGARLEQLYWEQVRRVTFGLARFSGGAIRLFGGWPVLLRLGPLVDGRRAILGGLIVREPGGSIAWKADGVHVVVEVEGFSPLLQGPLLRFETLFHDRVGRRFLARVAREVR
ncbi:MAG: hypothetical protein ACXVZL_02220 [Gaiellaceae bacterium]